jgi:ATP-binding cassette subfamily C protein
VSVNDVVTAQPEWAVLAGEGTAQEIDGSRPILLTDADDLWVVEAGLVQVFAVAIADGRAVGARSHFLTVPAGCCMLGMDVSGFGGGHGFLAVGGVGTRVRRLSIARLGRLLRDRPAAIAAVCALLDRWLSDLGRALTDGIAARPRIDASLTPGERIALENRAEATAQRGVVWLEVLGGNLLFVGMESLVFERAMAPRQIPGNSILLDVAELMQGVRPQRTLFPLPASAWIAAANAEGIETRLDCFAAESVARDPGFWQGLGVFHRALCQCEFINKKLQTVDELNRLRTKAEYADTARADAYGELARVLEIDRAKAPPAEIQRRDDPLLAACSVIGDLLRVPIRAHPEADPKLGFDRRVALIAKASRLRTRQVALRADWYRHDHGPMLGQLGASGTPVALAPTSAHGYHLVDPTTGARQKVSAEVASTLSPFAVSFYRRFPGGALGVFDLFRFGLPGLRRDVVTLAALGVALGLLGTVTPMLTGKLFDSAIPQADRSMVLQIVTAVFLVALISSAFSLTQAVASLRIQSRMDYSIQAALWDRMLDLPSRFFRGYSAGDLGERAAGINTIRSLVAGAGVGAVLGFLSSLFYLVLMFYYSATLAYAAVALTVIFVLVSFTANFLQLRYQREHLNAFGRLTGLVLQLISGVAKIRVAGAEDHAFRMWSRSFAHTRRLGFATGRIQNRVQVFNSGFGVLSSIVLFVTMGAALQRGGDLPGQGLSTGGFIAFTAAFGSFLAACLVLSEASLGMLRVVPIYERLRPILTTEPETDELKAYPGQLKGRIELSHVHFRYQADGPWILRDVSFSIEPGEFVALVGPSGSGKSTLLRLMLGFDQPEKGSIYYDGQALATLDLREVRSQLGVVLQAGGLMPTDIYRNIIGGDTSLTLDDAWQAARLAGFADDVAEMPMGMQTYISEGGGGLSGGQKQRLLIARALVRKPRIVFFDEATSALDNRTQSVVADSMAQMQATRVVIAHRLSTIRHADQIYVIEQGQVVERGTYDELMKLDGVFARLAQRQQA